MHQSCSKVAASAKLQHHLPSALDHTAMGGTLCFALADIVLYSLPTRLHMLAEKAMVYAALQDCPLTTGRQGNIVKAPTKLAKADSYLHNCFATIASQHYQQQCCSTPHWTLQPLLHSISNRGTAYHRGGVFPLSFSCCSHSTVPGSYHRALTWLATALLCCTVHQPVQHGQAVCALC